MHPPISLLQLLVPDDPLTHAFRGESMPTRADAQEGTQLKPLSGTVHPKTNETPVPFGVEGRL
jgi:hypothetical protein